MNCAYSATDRSTNFWPRVQRADLLEKNSLLASFRVRDHLWSGSSSPCRPRPRVRRHRARLDCICFVDLLVEPVKGEHLLDRAGFRRRFSSEASSPTSTDSAFDVDTTG